MTGTASTRRRILVAASAIAALAVVAGAAPSPATAEPGTAQAATIAKAQGAKAKTAQTPRNAKANTKANAKANAKAKAKAAVRAAAPASDFTSIFAGQQASLVNAGWTSCAAPISWSVDTGSLSADEAARQIANLKASFDSWAAASGLTFAYAGTASFRYNEADFSLTRTSGSDASTRSIHLAFIADEASSLLGGGTVGMAGPTTVWPQSGEIESGTGIFRIDALKSMTDAQAQALFTHELGHVFGLGHAADQGNIMYPVVSSNDTLGAGDVTGVKTMTKPCTA